MQTQTVCPPPPSRSRSSFHSLPGQCPLLRMLGMGWPAFPEGRGLGIPASISPVPQGTGVSWPCNRSRGGFSFPSAQDTDGSPSQGLPRGLLGGSGLPLLSQDHPPPGQLTWVQPAVPSRSHATETPGEGGSSCPRHCPVEQPAALPRPLEAGLPWSSPGPDCSGHLSWGVCALCPGFGSRGSRLSGWKLPQSRNIACAGLRAPLAKGAHPPKEGFGELWPSAQRRTLQPSWPSSARCSVSDNAPPSELSEHVTTCDGGKTSALQKIRVDSSSSEGSQSLAELPTCHGPLLPVREPSAGTWGVASR